MRLKHNSGHGTWSKNVQQVSSAKIPNRNRTYSDFKTELTAYSCGQMTPMATVLPYTLWDVVSVKKRHKKVVTSLWWVSCRDTQLAWDLTISHPQLNTSKNQQCTTCSVTTLKTYLGHGCQCRAEQRREAALATNERTQSFWTQSSMPSPEVQMKVEPKPILVARLRDTSMASMAGGGPKVTCTFHWFVLVTEHSFVDISNSWCASL